MPLINQVVESLEGAQPPHKVDLVLTDGDGTLFSHGTDVPFPGTLDYLEALEPRFLALVSGNNNKELAEARSRVINADGYFVPRVHTLVKHGLFCRAVDTALEHIPVETAAVLGNRWMCDVVAARVVLMRKGIKDNFGVYVKQEPSPEQFDKYIISPLETVGATAIKPLGLDQLIRARDQVAQGQ